MCGVSKSCVSYHNIIWLELEMCSYLIFYFLCKHLTVLQWKILIKYFYREKICMSRLSFQVQ